MDHKHTHAHHTPNALSFEEKLIRLVEHWIKHNEDHVKTYRDWIAQARKQGLTAAADRLEEAVSMTEATTDKFTQALSVLHRR